ncbi:alpha/beta-hydrolase [Mycena metata]|uniref:Carboxypeptidase n=1 Tax=Mycena metata TaxID=1033252 RepID=A0AAD7K6W3_9AGAR|nr:alpha/beta-hydrolase [Mycena metata]
MLRFALLSAATLVGRCLAQAPSTFPHVYPGMPTTPFGPEWQQYFEVTGALPNVTGTLPRSFAGNVGVNRPDHPNATLFFWGFEKANGTLTGAASDTDPWIIWLQGGPGSSSLAGLLIENGPLQVQFDGSITQNDFAWNKLADTFWVDQPVGVGYGTSDSTGYVQSEDQTGRDFVEFLSNLVKIFPSLAKRPLHLIGESYAGTYIPYITKALFSTAQSPVNLAKIAIGDGTIAAKPVSHDVPVLTLIETYPQLISYDPEVFEYFKTQVHLCGYDLNLTYPQNGHFPTLKDETFGASSSASLSSSSLALESLVKRVGQRSQATRVERRELMNRRESWKRDLAGRPNGTIDPFYGCSILDELYDYAANYTFPWTLGGFDPYDVPDALNPEVSKDPTNFFNDPATRSAIHAPDHVWVETFGFTFGAAADGTPIAESSAPPMGFLTDLATNASANGVGMIFYSGNDDSLVPHHGTEVVIQNMTFGGIQGFTRKPATPWTDDEGKFAGIIHQERNVTYALFAGSGHLVPQSVPAAAFVFVREFLLGSNLTGFLDSHTGKVVGGEVPALGEDVLPGNLTIYYGSGESGTTSLSTVAPSATIAAWEHFIATATATAKGST